MIAKAMTEEAANHERQKPSPSTLAATLCRRTPADANPPQGTLKRPRPHRPCRNRITAEHYDTARERLQKALRIHRNDTHDFTVLARTCWLSGDVTQVLNHVRRYEH
jgi:hypothetical protein